MSDPLIDPIADLQDRLRRLEDEAAIARVLYAYGSALDYDDRAQFLECFTEDADYSVTMRINHQGGMRFRGHDELAGYFDGHTHAPASWHKHITTNPSAVIRGDTATVTSYFIRVDAGSESRPATVLGSGRYRDEFVRDGDRWRIRVRVCEVENL